jgi:SAM-dependent methyltransferase
MEEPDMTQYVIDPAWGQERERLAMLEEWTDPMTERRLQAVGVREGMRCLEVGAGSGSVARWLAEQVGPSGHVCAVDIDTRFLRGLDDPRIEVVEADLLADPLPGDFDLVHARALIHHLPDAVEGLRRLLDCLKPGGRILVEEPDSFAGQASADPVQHAVWDALAAVPALDFHCGRRLVAHLRGLGVDDLDAEVEVHAVHGGTRLATWHRLSMQALRPHLLAAGLAEETFETALAALEDPAFLEIGFAWVAAWGTRR